MLFYNAVIQWFKGLAEKKQKKYLFHEYLFFLTDSFIKTDYSKVMRMSLKLYFLKAIFVFTTLLCVQNLAWNQTNPNDVSIFSRIEAGVFPGEYLEIDPFWLEMHPPEGIGIYLATSAGIVAPSPWHWSFERDASCRITKMNLEDASAPNRVYKRVFAYDDLHSKITVTTIDSEYGVGVQHYLNRSVYEYDGAEKIVTVEQFSFSSALNNWESKYKWVNTQFDNCKNFEKQQLSGLSSNQYTFTNEYQPGNCLLKSRFKQGLNSWDFESLAYGYDNDMRTIWLRYSFSSNCLQFNFEYDATGNRMLLNTGPCANPNIYPKFRYSWNNDHSLASIDNISSAADTFYRKVIEYGSCSSVSSHEIRQNYQPVRLKSPAMAGDWVQVFDLPESELFSWTMTDIQGRVLQEGQIDADNEGFILPEGILPGVYVLGFRSPKKTLIARLICQ